MGEFEKCKIIHFKIVWIEYLLLIKIKYVICLLSL